MSKNFMEEAVETVETTIGELIETITSLALEAGKSEQESYELAALAVEQIMRRNRVSAPVLN